MLIKIDSLSARNNFFDSSFRGHVLARGDIAIFAMLSTIYPKLSTFKFSLLFRKFYFIPKLIKTIDILLQP